MLDVIIALVMVLNVVVTFVGGHYLSLLIGKNVEKVKRATGVDFGLFSSNNFIIWPTHYFRDSYDKELNKIWKVCTVLRISFFVLLLVFLFLLFVVRK